MTTKSKGKFHVVATVDAGALGARPTLESRKGGAPGKPEGKCRSLAALGMTLVWIDGMDDTHSAAGVLARMDESYAEGREDGFAAGPAGA
jgi:hypothetical protein